MADTKRTALIEVVVNKDAAQASFEKLTASINQNKDAVKKNNLEIKELQKQNEALAKQVKDGSLTQEQAGKTLEENTKRINALSGQNVILNKSTADLNKERANEVKTMQLSQNSLAALRAETAKMQKELEGLDTSTSEGSARFNELTKTLEANRDKIVTLDQKTGSYTTTIGRYKQEVGAAIRETGIGNTILSKFGETGEIVKKTYEGTKNILNVLTVAMGTASGATASQTAAQAGLTTATAATTVGMTAATIATRIFTAALIATGIGAIVVALGSLVAYLTQTDEGMDVVDETLGKVKATIQPLIGLFADLGEAAYKFVTGDWSGAADAAGRAKDKWNSLGDTIDANIKKAGDLAKEKQKLEDAEIDFVGKKAQLEADISKAKALKDDDTLSTKQRLDALDEIHAKNKQVYDTEVGFVKTKLKIYEAEAKYKGYLTDEDKKKINELNAEITKLETEYWNTEREASKVRKALIEGDKKALEERVKARIEANKKVVDSVQEQYSAEQILTKSLADNEYASIEVRKKALEDYKALVTDVLAVQESNINQISTKNKLGEAYVTGEMKRISGERAKNEQDFATAYNKILTDEAKQNVDLFNAKISQNNELIKSEKTTQAEKIVLLKNNSALEQSIVEANGNAKINALRFEQARFQSLADSGNETAVQAAKDLGDRIIAVEQNIAEQKKAINEKVNSEIEAQRTEASEKEIKQRQSTTQQVLAVISQGVEVTKGILQAEYQREVNEVKAKHEAEIASLDNKMNAEINNLDRRNMTEEQFQARQKQIQDKYAAQKLEADKKEKQKLYQMELAKWKADLALSIGQAIINIAQGVTLALATAPPPFNFINAGLVAAAGGVQIGILATQAPPEPPKFASGGEVTRMYNIGGQYHSSGGTLFTGSDGTRFEAERGERLFVTNDSQHAQALSAITSKRVTSYLENGGEIPRQAPSIIEQLNGKIWVSVGDIQKGVQVIVEANKAAQID